MSENRVSVIHTFTSAMLWALKRRISEQGYRKIMGTHGANKTGGDHDMGRD